MKTILVYGTFDLFHIGHLNLLRRARAFGDRLVAGVSTDEFNLAKGKTSAIPFSDRIQIVAACRYVDIAIPESSWEQKAADINTYAASVVIVDQPFLSRLGFIADRCQVIALPRTEGISTTQLKERLGKGGGE